MFDVAADGALSGKTPLITVIDQADSMCIDAGGNVYVGMNRAWRCSGPTALGHDRSRSAWTSRTAASAAPTARRCYITAWTSICRVDGMPIPGLDWQVNQGIRCD